MQTGSFEVLGTTEEAVDMGVGTVPTLCRISSISEGVNRESWFVLLFGLKKKKTLAFWTSLTTFTIF